MGLDVYFYETPPVKDVTEGVEIDYSIVPSVWHTTQPQCTHNLTKMAQAADLYMYLWHPEDAGIVQAKELRPYLQEGLTKLIAEPEKYQAYNSENGWGTYESFVHFVQTLFLFTVKYPDAYYIASP